MNRIARVLFRFDARLGHRRGRNIVVSGEGFVVTIAGALVQGSTRDMPDAIHHFGLSIGSAHLYVRQHVQDRSALCQKQHCIDTARAGRFYHRWFAAERLRLIIDTIDLVD